jgi:F-type H+-transporting ATPase subunit delta
VTGGSIARRYARALMGIGVERGNYEALGRGLQALADAVAGSRELREALTNPVFPQSQRRAALDALLARLARDRALRALLMMLLERGRVGDVPAVAREFRVLADRQAGRVWAEVTSPRPLDAGQVAQLTQALVRATRKTVVLEQRTDPALLGGVRVKVGSMLYDGSLSSRLLEARESLLAE